MAYETIQYLFPDRKCKIHRNRVTNHLITHVHIRIQKFKIIWESLDPCTFTNCQSPIQMFFPLDKTHVVWTELFHLWSLWVKLTLTP